MRSVIRCQTKSEAVNFTLGHRDREEELEVSTENVGHRVLSANPQHDRIAAKGAEKGYASLRYADLLHL